LKTSRLVSFWADKGDLSTKVLTAVMQAVNLSPGIGWVRGDQAIDPKVLQDTERLRIENAELKQRLAEIRSEQVTFPQGLIGPDETIELTVSGYIQNNQQKETLPDQQAIVKLGDLFVYIFDRLLVEPIEHALKTIVGRAAAAVGLSNSFREKAVYSIGSRDVRTLRFQYEALGLIQAQGQVSVQPFRQEYVAWTVTEKGRRYVAQTMAIRRAGA
jgi:hypothetical protein